MSRTVTLLAAVALVGLAGSPVRAGDADDARQAVERGDVRPLDQVLDVARKRLPGEVVKVKLEHDDGRWTYEIKILTEKGERREIEIDAQSLRVRDID